MKIPQTSSITIQPGSSVPVSFIAFFTNGMAAKKTSSAAIIKFLGTARKMAANDSSAFASFVLNALSLMTMG